MVVVPRVVVSIYEAVVVHRLLVRADNIIHDTIHVSSLVEGCRAEYLDNVVVVELVANLLEKLRISPCLGCTAAESSAEIHWALDGVSTSFCALFVLTMLMILFWHTTCVAKSSTIGQRDQALVEHYFPGTGATSVEYAVSAHLGGRRTQARPSCVMERTWLRGILPLLCRDLRTLWCSRVWA